MTPLRRWLLPALPLLFLAVVLVALLLKRVPLSGVSRDGATDPGLAFGGRIEQGLPFLRRQQTGGQATQIVQRRLRHLRCMRRIAPACQQQHAQDVCRQRRRRQ